jgi:hypothetical protein
LVTRRRSLVCRWRGDDEVEVCAVAADSITERMKSMPGVGTDGAADDR